MENTFGSLFRVTTWGESHGGSVGAVVDGCPPQLELAEADIQPQLDRRRPGQSRLTTPRREPDRVRFLSGVFEGRTLGTPIALAIDNVDARPAAYDRLKDVYRPSHADFTYEAKFGIRDWRGGGRASARETAARVAAGAIAEKILRLAEGTDIVAYVLRVAGIETTVREVPDRATVDRTVIRCPDLEAAARMEEAVDAARRAGDSVGGVIEAVIRGAPPGLGGPVFDRLEADLGKALLSLPACKGFEIGSGFGGTNLRGSEHNDPFVRRRRGRGRPPVGTSTNHSGGVQGGISNGEAIVLRVAFKPTATIARAQRTLDRGFRPVELKAQGRHDPCVLPRAVPLVEAMCALVLVDHWLRQIALAEASRRLGPAPRPAAGPGRRR